jgi:hypothetical protein
MVDMLLQYHLWCDIDSENFNKKSANFTQYQNMYDTCGIYAAGDMYWPYTELNKMQRAT